MDSRQERRGPETTPGTEPGDDQIPEHSRGMPIDMAQPSAPHRPELESQEDHSTAADVRSDKRDV